MTIEVTLPDGSVAAFPDGTPEAVITNALMQHAPGAGAPPAAPAAAAGPEPVTLNKVVRSAATGVPLVGGVLNKLNAATNATLAPAVEPFLTKGPETLDQPTWAERYAKSLELQNAQDQQFSEEHPVVDTAAQIVGGVGATLPLAATGVGGTLLGMGGRSLVGQTARSAASGGVINAADAAIRGHDPAAGGAIGTAIGAAAPITGRIAAAAASPVINTVRGIVNPARQAERVVAGGVQRAQELNLTTPGNPRNAMTTAEFRAAEAEGLPVNVMDIAGEPGRDIARSAANISPEGRHVLNRAIDDRFETQSQRMAGTLRTEFNFPNVEAQDAALSNLERTVNQEAYREAHEVADAAIRRDPNALWNTELRRLSGAPDIQAAMAGVGRKEGNRSIIEGLQTPRQNPFVRGEGTRMTVRETDTTRAVPDLNVWDSVQRVLRGKIGEAVRGGNRERARELTLLRNQVLAAVDEVVPEFATARAGAAGFFGAHNALEAGQMFAMPAARFENRGAQAAIARMNPLERRLFEDGFVDRLAQQMSEAGNRRNVAGMFLNSDAGIERLRMTLGPRADRIEAMMRVERLMDLARGAVQGNSTTARQLAQLGISSGVGTLSTGGTNPLDPQAVVHAALVYGALRGRGAINERVSRQVAELLTSNNLDRVQQGMRMIAQPRFLDALRRADNAVSRSISVQAQPEPSQAVH